MRTAENHYFVSGVQLGGAALVVAAIAIMRR